MTTRNFRFAYWIFSIVSVLALAGSILLAIRTGTDKWLPFFLADAKLYTEYFFFGAPVGIQLAAALQICFLLLCSSAVLIIIFFTFQKTVSAEVYLIALWAFLVDAEALRLVMLIISQRSTSIGPLVSLTRVVYGARFTGLISLFISGLYAVGIGHERPQTGYLLAILFGAMIAMLIPISIDRFQSSFMLAAGYRDITMIVTISLIVINFIDYVVAARLKEDSSYVFAGIGLTIAAGSWVWLWNTRPLTGGIGIALLFAAGLFGVIERLHKIYIWK